MASTISGDFIFHVKGLYSAALSTIGEGSRVVIGNNTYYEDALVAFPLAVLSVEAFFNEIYLSNLARLKFPDSTVWDLPHDVLEKMSLLDKLEYVPKVFFGKTFIKGNQPYQDMKLLIRIRNELVHYKMPMVEPAFVQILDRKEILLRSKHPEGDFEWVHKLSCSESIKWAHNTACLVVQTLVGFDTQRTLPLAETMAKNFVPIA